MWLVGELSKFLYLWVLVQLAVVIAARPLGCLSDLSTSPDLTEPVTYKLFGLFFNST